MVYVGFPGGPVAHAGFPALTSLEICAGAGGQALGLERAGFSHEAVVELDADACGTLRYNRQWKVIEGDVANVDGRAFAGLDLFAGGVPCPPFSIAGKQLGSDDERDLFPQALRLIEEIGPRTFSSSTARLASRRGGTWCTRAITGSPSCGLGSC